MNLRGLGLTQPICAILCFFELSSAFLLPSSSFASALFSLVCRSFDLWFPTFGIRAFHDLYEDLCEFPLNQKQSKTEQNQSTGIFEKFDMAEANPPRFDGTNYSLWAVRMKFYLKGVNLWEYTQGEVSVPVLRQNPTVAQIKRHEDVIARTNRAVTTLHNAVLD